MIAGRLPLPIGLTLRRVPTLDELVTAHRQMVLRTAYRLLGNLEDAQDAAQEVFLRLFRHHTNLDADPRAWLYRVTVNVCNDQHRQRRPVAELAIENADPGPDPERLMTLKQRKELIGRGLTLLAARERACLVLRDIEGLSTAEVATILDIEEVTVRTHVHTARIKLAKYVRSRK